MSFVQILETLLLGPLKLIFEIIFIWANNIAGSPGWAIIILSIIMNLLVLPLYKRADAMQQKARDAEHKLSAGIAHIKKSFTGDERMMILQTYYRQNHYKPTDALKGSMSLLLQIPFFMAAYRFLSNLDLLTDTSFTFISDLSSPDGLLVLGDISINLLPIAMTLINIISSSIFLKGSGLKEKLQLYTMALVFLILLYNSPASLVFYWTLNNFFSLVKNIILVYKPSRQQLNKLASVTGVLLFLLGLHMQAISILEVYTLFPIAGILLQLPLLHSFLKKIRKNTRKFTESPANPRLFLYEMIFMTLLLGLLIPSTYIAASPQEYVFINNFHHPLWYIVSSFCMAAGLFLVWMHIFYSLFENKYKVLLENIAWVICGLMLINYMFFGTNLGIISSSLRYEKVMVFTVQEQVLNLEVVCICSAILYYIIANKKRYTAITLLIPGIAFLFMSMGNLVTIKNSISEIHISDTNEDVDIPSFTFSQTGQNVIVIMLDRAFNAYVPYIFNEKPELLRQFDGFTHYSNTVSFGNCTNIASPALLGGYEYTPVEINKRDTETLVDKHNEALLVLPVLFSENDYEVTVCDPPYANYQMIPDLSIYDNYPKIDAYITQNIFFDDNQEKNIIKNNHRNFFLFSIMKTAPLFFQDIIYDNGYYNKLKSNNEFLYDGQIAHSVSTATGVSSDFMGNYIALLNLSTMSSISADNQNTFLFLSNTITHEPNLLQTPDYVPAQVVDNTQYDAAIHHPLTIAGHTLQMDNIYQMTHYHANMAALSALGDWFDYLRENNVYDNTRIILVGDHGRNLEHFDDLIFINKDGSNTNAESYFPLLMVKDFNSIGFSTSSEFMTNADVPTLTTQDIITSPINPFTNNLINSSEKETHAQYISLSETWDTIKNNGYTFLPSSWASVKDNVWNPSNWIISDKNAVLKEHKLP